MAWPDDLSTIRKTNMCLTELWALKEQMEAGLHTETIMSQRWWENASFTIDVHGQLYKIEESFELIDTVIRLETT